MDSLRWVSGDEFTIGNFLCGLLHGHAPGVILAPSFAEWVRMSAAEGLRRNWRSDPPVAWSSVIIVFLQLMDTALGGTVVLGKVGSSSTGLRKVRGRVPHYLGWVAIYSSM